MTFLEKCDRRLLTKIKNNVNHPLYTLWPKVKESPKRLRSRASQLSRINKERFQNWYFNPFAPGDFAEKRVLKVVEWLSGHCGAITS